MKDIDPSKTGDHQECDHRVTFLDDIPIDEKNAENLLLLWRQRCHKSAKAHYRGSEEMFQQSAKLTVTNTIFSIAILFFINADWVRETFFNTDDSKPIFTAFAGISGLLLVLTTILQYIFRYTERAQDHKSAGSEFSNLQRKIERYLAGRFFKMGFLHNINREYSYITKLYPLVPARIWESNELKVISHRIAEMEEEIGLHDIVENPDIETKKARNRPEADGATS